MDVPGRKNCQKKLAKNCVDKCYRVGCVEKCKLMLRNVDLFGMIF